MAHSVFPPYDRDCLLFICRYLSVC
jgi:hypothetical protein